MNIYVAGVVVSILAYTLIGLWAGKKVKNIEDYYVSGRNASTLLISGTLFASMLSVNGFMGDPAYAYGGNLTTMILLNTLCALGYVYGPMLFGRYIRRVEATTLPGYFGARFNSRRLRCLAGIITIVSLTSYLLAVLQGTTLLMQILTDLPNLPCLFISLACVTVFTVYSGSRGVLFTDTAMFLLFIGATAIAGPFVFKASGGFMELITNLFNSPSTPPGLLDYHGNPGSGTPFDIVMYALINGIMWFLVVGVSPWQCGRNLMARNEHVIMRSGTVSALLTVTFLTYMYLMAVSINLIYPNMPQPDRVLIWASFNVMPTLVGVLMVTGIMAAGLSSASTFLSVISFSMASDVLNIKFSSEIEQLRFNRMAMFVVCLVALILAAMNLASIRIIAWFSGTLIASAWAFVAFASVWSKRITERGAFWGMLGGLLGYVIPKGLNEFTSLNFQNFTDPFFIGLTVSIVLGICLSRRQERTPAEINFHTRMMIQPESECLPADYRRDRVYYWVLTAFGVVISLGFITYWALPYSTLRGL